MAPPITGLMHDAMLHALYSLLKNVDVIVTSVQPRGGGRARSVDITLTVTSDISGPGSEDFIKLLQGHNSSDQGLQLQALGKALRELGEAVVVRERDGRIDVYMSRINDEDGPGTVFYTE